MLGNLKTDNCGRTCRTVIFTTIALYLFFHHLYLNNIIFIAKFSKMTKFIYKLAKFVFRKHIVVFYKVFCHNIFPLD